MVLNKELAEALEICGFMTGEKQESRLLSVLNVILKLQRDPPIPLTFSEIYEQIQREDPSTTLTKAWIHKVLKALIDVHLIRVDSPTSHRKRYIADVNTVMAGLEHLKSQRTKQLDMEITRIQDDLANVNALDCGTLAQEYIRDVTGEQQEIRSRVVRGVEELHRILKYNMLDIAKEGDIVRATLLWLAPFMDGKVGDRMIKFIEASERGAEIRYLITAEATKLDDINGFMPDEKSTRVLVMNLIELRKKGAKFDVRFYQGQKTYNQVSFNNDSMVLIITENPMTATWITRQFNPDLIDNAVKSFDRDWKKARSFFELTPQDMVALGIVSGGMIDKLVNPRSKEDNSE